MDTSPAPNSETPPNRSRRRRGGWSLRLTSGGIFFIFVADVVLLTIISWPVIKDSFFTPPTATLEALVIPSETPGPTPTTTLEPDTPTAIPNPTQTPLLPYPDGLLAQDPGVVILSLSEGVHFHLFAYSPQSLPLTRLTSGPWDDIHPAISPDGQRLAFASNRNGYWDLYQLDLPSGEITRITDSLEYDGSPTWSPDGLWLAYESYSSERGSLGIAIRSMQEDQAAISLSEGSTIDSYPSWSPSGRKLAFVSTRSGEPDIWLADLDKAGKERYLDLSDNSSAVESHPVWSPDGKYLAWSSVEDGMHSLLVWDSSSPALPPRLAGSGDWPAWSPDSKILLTVLLQPNQDYLAAYELDIPGLVLPAARLPGQVSGLAWGKPGLLERLPDPFNEAARVTPTALWIPEITRVTDVPNGRMQVAPLDDLQAPHPVLNDLVDESFRMLRTDLATIIGWDFLSTLENAYVPLTTPLDPGKGRDWLYTGRAIAVNSLTMNAGWMEVVRQDFGDRTFWRVYLKVRYTDGSAGMPLHELPWDFSARLSGDTTAYEQGGRLAAKPEPGYWLDFTQLAASYGWERLPALSSWRTSYPEARFNEFALTSGLDWRAAMLELYPAEALITPTPLVPPTRTLTPTPFWYQSPTPTETPTPRPTLTPISPTPTEVPTDTLAPTLTSSPTATHAPTLTPSPTITPAPSLTPTPVVTPNPVPSASPAPQASH